jgi:tetratricopeptide (TPR) repeat protein
MISQDKLFFGKLIDEKIYIEGYGDDIEVLPLENFYFNRSQCYMNLGEYTIALSDLTKALEINPNVTDPRFFHNIGNIIVIFFHLAIISFI